MTTDPRPPQVFHRHKCPFCRRLRAYLAEKGIEAELLKFHPDDDIEALRAINPKAQVPTWQAGELGLFESFIIMQFLEEQHPEPPMMPEAPLDRARTRLIFDLADNLFAPSMIGFVRAPVDHPSRPEHEDDILVHSAEIARLLPPAGPFVFGERFTMADLSLPPLLYRCVEAGLDPAALPGRVRDWGLAVLRRPSVAELYPSVGW